MRTATYGRYSTDQQRDASLDDQFRDNRALCVRHGFPLPKVYQDAEISGERRDRPGYVALLRDAQAGAFDVLVLWDLKRLSRAEDLPQVLARFRFWGVRIVTCDGYDSSQEGSDIRGWIDGLMGNRYIRDLAKATHRGLSGRALEGASAGGLSYGYRVTETGQREINAAEAEVVRRIFAEYIAGSSPRTIAAGLNRDRVPSPRGGTWAMTAIRADVRRGIGILGNPIYIGRQVWNRSRWVKHPESGRRVRQERPEAEWLTSEKPELAIIDEATWQAAQRRCGGAKHDATNQKGRPPSHLLSGILRCGECGGPMVVIDRYQYGCATAKDRGTCSSRVRFARRHAESVLMAGVQEELLGEAGFARFQRAALAAMKRQAPDIEGAKRKLAAAEVVHANVMAAIRAGIITPSTKAELITAEKAIDQARKALSAVQQMQPAQIMPRAREVWRRMVADVSDHVRNVPAARNALRSLIGDRIVVHEKAGVPYAEIAGSTCQINMVAGAGSVLYLTEPLRIPLSRGS